jgi:hypothetical protein
MKTVSRNSPLEPCFWRAAHRRWPHRGYRVDDLPAATVAGIELKKMTKNFGAKIQNFALGVVVSRQNIQLTI